MTCKVNADTTNGLKLTSDTSGEIDLQTNGTTKVHMDSSGNVGIGDSSPAGLLHVGTGDNLDGTDVDIYIGGNGTNTRQSIIRKKIQSSDRALEFIAASGATNEDIRFYSDATTERMRINSSGNVGIGTSSPVGKLAVSDGTVVGEINPYSPASGCYIGTRTNHSVLFQVNASEKMRINSSGNVGIGTTSPSQKLDVNGTINATAFATSPVLSAIAGLSFGAVGTFCFARRSNNTTAGSTYAGSQLRRAGLMSSGFNTNAYEYNYGSTLSGTWRSLGTADDTRNSNPCYTIYVRIS